VAPSHRRGGGAVDGQRCSGRGRSRRVSKIEQPRDGALDSEVRYRSRLLAAQPERIDDETAERVVADAELLAETGHNGVVSMAGARLGEHLPAELPE